MEPNERRNMLKGRKFTLTVEKPTVEPGTDDKRDDRPLEDKAELYLKILERVGVELLVGICIYVLLDTRRKVAVAKASNPIA